METLYKYADASTWHDYHEEHLGKDAVWFGRGAGILGLGLTVSQEDAVKVFSARHPATNDPLRKRLGTVAVYELTYSTPKSVSVMALYDERIESMVMTATKVGMELVEKHAFTRERSGPDHNSNKISPTATIIAALVPNFSNRSGEPQQHVHAGIANLTFDEADAQWTALQIEWIFVFENRCLVDLVCHNELAKQLSRAGYRLVKTDFAFEVSGVDSQFLDAASTRRREVLAATDGLRQELSDLRAKPDLTRKEAKRLAFLGSMDDRTLRDHAARISRESKSEPSLTEIRRQFEEAVARQDLDVSPLMLLAAQAKSATDGDLPHQATQAELVKSGLSQLESTKVATRGALIMAMLSAHLGRTSLDAVQETLASPQFALICEDSPGVFTTPAHLFTLSKASQALAFYNGTEVPLRLVSPRHHEQLSQAAEAAINYTGIWLVISSRSCTSRILRDELEAKLGLSHAVVVRPATELFDAVFNFTGFSRTIFVVDDPIDAGLAAIVAYLESRGALRFRSLDAAAKKLTIRQLEPEAAEQDIVGEFLAAKCDRGRFPQILAATAEGAVALVKKVRQALFSEKSSETYVAGDQVRATGDNRLGKGRTERNRLYRVTQVTKAGALKLNGRLHVPPGFKHLEPGYAVADPAQVAPNAGLILIGPGVSLSAIKKVKSERPKATMIIFSTVRALVRPMVRWLRGKRRRKIVHAVAYESLVSDLSMPAIEISGPTKSINSIQQHHEHHQDKPARESLLR